MSDDRRRERPFRVGVPFEVLTVLALIATGIAPLAQAEGHGPLFALATPTLARGQWSSDTALMQMDAAGRDTLAYREVLGYGITPDLQAVFAFPLQRPDDRIAANLRGGAMMGSMDGLEGSMIWRFQRTAPAVGVRRESSLIGGISRPLNDTQAGVPVGPSFHLAAVTGYASRTIYWWVGAGTLQFLARRGGQPGALYYASGVFGYRPPAFRHDFPRPDCEYSSRASPSTASATGWTVTPCLRAAATKSLLDPRSSASTVDGASRPECSSPPSSHSTATSLGSTTARSSSSRIGSESEWLRARQ